MIQFQQNNYLYLLFLIPVLLACWLVYCKRQSDAFRLLGEPLLVSKLVISSPKWLLRFKFSVVLLVFVFLIIALAGPYSNAIGAKHKSSPEIEIVFLVDVSRSMYVKDIAPDRISRAQVFIKEVIGKLDNQSAGIVVFAGKASIFVPLTDDYYYLGSSVDNISNDLISVQGTSLPEALKIAALSFSKEPQKMKVLCLLSDGEFHKNPDANLADSLRNSGINIFTFGFGSPGGGEITTTNHIGEIRIEKDAEGDPIVSKLNSDALLKIAGNKKSHYMQVEDKSVSTELFMNELTILKTQYTMPNDENPPCFRLCLCIALLLTLIECCIPQVFKFNNPTYNE